MNMPIAADAAPLDDEMLSMDVVDTLRHDASLSAPADGQDTRTATIDRLIDYYGQHGIDLSEAAAADGIAALATSRYDYRPPHGPAAALAWLYVGRARWQRPVLAGAGAIVVVVLAYFLAYQPWRASQAERAQQELAQALPARMDALYQAIFNETKVQSAVSKAETLLSAGKQAAKAGDRAAAVRAVADLVRLRDQLEAAYTLRVVDQPGVKPGFWTFPANNTEATNYYIVVEAIGGDGKVLSLPITNDDTGTIQTVNRWGLRVPEAIYDAVMSDRADDGKIEHNLVGFKQDGFLDIDYIVPVLGGTVTQW